MRQGIMARTKLLIIVPLVLALLVMGLYGCSSGSGTSTSSSSSKTSSKTDINQIVSQYYSSNKPSKVGSVQNDWFWYSQSSAMGISGKTYQPDTCLKEVYVTSSSASSGVKIGCVHVFLDSSGSPTKYVTRTYTGSSNATDLEMAITQFSQVAGRPSAIHTYLFFVRYSDGSSWGYEELGTKYFSEIAELDSKGVLINLGASGITMLG